MYIVTQLSEHFLDMNAHIFRCDSYKEAMELAEDIANTTAESEPYADTSGEAYIFKLETKVTHNDPEPTRNRRVGSLTWYSNAVAHTLA